MRARLPRATFRVRMTQRANPNAPETISISGVIGTTTGFWERVDAALRERGWTLSFFAETHCHCSRQYLVRLFERPQMPASYYLAICRVLGFDPASILDTEGWIPAPKPPTPPTSLGSDQ